MDGYPYSKFQQILDRGYRFRMGDYISKGFELFGKNAGMFIGYTFVFMLISMLSSVIPVIGPIVNGFILSPALTVGFFLVAHKLNKGEGTAFEDFFKGFDRIGQLALATLLETLIIMGSLIPAFITLAMVSGGLERLMDINMFSAPPIGSILLIFLLIIPAIYLGVAYSWTYMFIAFYGMPAWESMEMSRKMISKDWFTYFAFSIVLGLLAIVGFIALFIGILVAIPIIYSAQYAAFSEVTQLLEAEGSEDYDIMDQLVEE